MIDMGYVVVSIHLPSRQPVHTRSIDEIDQDIIEQAAQFAHRNPGVASFFVRTDDHDVAIATALDSIGSGTHPAEVLLRETD